MAQMVKNLPAMWEIWVQSLGWEDPLEKGTATHSSIVAWRIPWTEELSWLQSMGHKELDTTEPLTLSLSSGCPGRSVLPSAPFSDADIPCQRRGPSLPWASWEGGGGAESPSSGSRRTMCLRPWPSTLLLVSAASVLQVPTMCLVL